MSLLHFFAGWLTICSLAYGQMLSAGDKTVTSPTSSHHLHPSVDIDSIVNRENTVASVSLESSIYTRQSPSHTIDYDNTILPDSFANGRDSGWNMTVGNSNSNGSEVISGNSTLISGGANNSHTNATVEIEDAGNALESDTKGLLLLLLCLL